MHTVSLSHSSSSLVICERTKYPPTTSRSVFATVCFDPFEVTFTLETTQIPVI